MNWTPYLVAWTALAFVVLGLAAYRKVIARAEDGAIHVSGDGSTIGKQKSIAHKLEAVDRWGKTLSVVCLLFGLWMLGAYIYSAWQAGSKLSY